MPKYLEIIQKISEPPLLNLKIISNNAVTKINLTLDHDNNNDNAEQKSETYIINVNVQ